MPLVVSVCVVDVNVLVVIAVDVLLEVELVVVVDQVAQSTGQSACICTATSPKMPSVQIMSGNTPVLFSKILSRVATKTIVMWWSLKQSTAQRLLHPVF
jgi:hypothetical protein